MLEKKFFISSSTTQAFASYFKKLTFTQRLIQQWILYLPSERQGRDRPHWGETRFAFLSHSDHSFLTWFRIAMRDCYFSFIEYLQMTINMAKIAKRISKGCIKSYYLTKFKHRCSKGFSIEKETGAF